MQHFFLKLRIGNNSSTKYLHSILFILYTYVAKAFPPITKPFLMTNNMKRPSFQFYPKDFLSDPNVIAMTNEEVGGYIKLLAMMWNTEACSLPNNDEVLCKLSGLDKGGLSVVKECFFGRAKNLFHKRLLKERKKQDEWRSKSSIGGKRSALKRWGKPKTKAKNECKGGYQMVVTNRQPNDNTSSSTATTYENDIDRPMVCKNFRKKDSKGKISKVPYDDGFLRFYLLYPKKKSKKRAYGAWKKLTEDEKNKCMATLPNHIKSNQWQVPKFIPHPSTWLNDELWEDELKTDIPQTAKDLFDKY